tara:strand:+ start:14397 stop:15161 length:765 start_codon:yes stop_codon:yes gene_type:complete
MDKPQSFHESSQPPISMDEEKRLKSLGYKLITGIDEVGRGPLAGPVVAGAAIVPIMMEDKWLKIIRDSKQLTSKKRAVAADELRKSAIVATGQSTPKEIDNYGIVSAVNLAIKRALVDLDVDPDYLLLDAFKLPGTNLPQKAIIRGDSSCISIGSASIVAKVARDALMDELHECFPEYGFNSNKGYGTKSHINAIKTFGPCSIHRFSFKPVREIAKDHNIFLDRIDMPLTKKDISSTPLKLHTQENLPGFYENK